MPATELSTVTRSSGTAPITPLKDRTGWTGGGQFNFYLNITSHIKKNMGIFELDIPVPMVFGFEFGAFYEERRYTESSGSGGFVRYPVVKFPFIFRLFLSHALSFGAGFFYARSRPFLPSENALSPALLHTAFKDEVGGVASAHINLFPKSKLGLRLGKIH